MVQEESSILDMDFGDLMGTSGQDIGDPTPIEDPLKEDEKEKIIEEPELEVNKILETEQADDLEKEEIEVTDDKKKSPDSSKNIKTSSSDPFALVYAKFLLESGSISSFDEEAFKDVIEEEGEAGALQHLISGEIESAKAGIMGSLEGYEKEYAELRGLGVDSESAAGMVNSIEDVEAITEEAVENEDNEQLRRSILTAYYKETTQFTDTRIKKLVDRNFELGEDAEEAKEALSSLKEVRKSYVENVKIQQKQAEEKRKKDNQESLSNLKTKIEELKEIIPGQKINKQTKDKIEDLLIKPIKQLENGQVLNGIWSRRAEDQLDFDIKLAHFIQLGLFDGKLDILKKKAKSSAINELESHIKQQGDYTGSGRTPNKENKASRDMISSMKNIF